MLPIPESWLLAIAGGLLIGLASVGLMITLGRIAGISGIVFTAIRSPLDEYWAVFFVLGLAIGAYIFHSLSGFAIPLFDPSTELLVVGGLLVGLGTKLGSGCTSGHGICGLGRLSVRSFVATLTFMVFGILTVTIRLHGGVL